LVLNSFFFLVVIVENWWKERIQR